MDMVRSNFVVVRRVVALMERMFWLMRLSKEKFQSLIATIQKAFACCTAAMLLVAVIQIIFGLALGLKIFVIGIKKVVRIAEQRSAAINIRRRLKRRFAKA